MTVSSDRSWSRLNYAFSSSRWSICRYAGRAIGLTSIVRSFVLQAAQEQLFLPADLLQKHGLTPQLTVVALRRQLAESPASAPSSSSPSMAASRVIRTEDSPNGMEAKKTPASSDDVDTLRAVRDALFDVAVLANAYVEDARALTPDVPHEGLSALLPVVRVCHRGGSYYKIRILIGSTSWRAPASTVSKAELLRWVHCLKLYSRPGGRHKVVIDCCLWVVAGCVCVEGEGGGACA